MRHVPPDVPGLVQQEGRHALPGAGGVCKTRKRNAIVPCGLLHQFLDRHRADSVTERLNAFYEHNPSEIDPAFVRAQLKSLSKKW